MCPSERRDRDRERALHKKKKKPLPHFVQLSPTLTMTDSKQNWSPIEGLLSHKYRRTIYLAALALTIITLLTFYSAPISSRRTTTTTTTTTKTATSSGHKGEWDWDWRRDAGNLLMTDEQCGAAFPGLFVEIERAMDTRKENKITFEELDAIKPQYGYGRAMIYDQQVSLPHLNAISISISNVSPSST